MNRGNRKYSQKRIETPQNRLKRAVSYRHVNKYRAVDQRLINVSEIAEINADEKQSFDVELMPIGEQTKQTHRQKRRNKKNEWIEAMVLQPNASIWKTLFHPIKTINQAADSEYISIGAFHGLIWNFIAWFFASACIAYFYADDIIRHEFSIMRYNFTDTCWLALRITLYGLIIVYLCYLGSFLYGRLIHHPISLKKVIEVDTLASAPAGILFIACLLLIRVSSSSLGIMIFTAAAACTGALKIYGFKKAGDFFWMQALIYACAAAAVYLLLYQVFYSLCLGDLAKIYALL